MLSRLGCRVPGRVLSWGAAGGQEDPPHAPATCVCSCFLMKSACNHCQTSLCFLLINPRLLWFPLQDPQPGDPGGRAKAAAAKAPSASPALARLNRGARGAVGSSRDWEQTTWPPKSD